MALSYKVFPGTPYYTTSALTTEAGTIVNTIPATYVNTTYGTVSIGGTTYYVAYGQMISFWNSSFTGQQIDDSITKVRAASATPAQNGTDLFTTGGAFALQAAAAEKSDLSDISQTGSTCTEANGIAAGLYFYLDGDLVVAKTAISYGDPFTLNTNYEPPTAGALNALKSAIDTKIDKSGAYFSFLNAQIVNDNDNWVLFSAESSVEMMAGASKNVVASTNGSFKCLSTTHGSYKPVDASAFNVQSSYLIKENIQNLTAEDAKKILSIRPVSFDYKKGFGESNQYGVIAEEAREIIPFAVTVPNEYDETRFDEAKGIDQPILSVDYSKFIPHLIRMIQIQQQEIEKLKAKIEAT